MITYYFRSVKEEKLQQIDEPRAGTWAHVENPSADELDQLSLRFALDRDLLQDAVDFFEVPRFEFEDGIAYFYTRFPHEITGDVSTAPILFIVTPDTVITVAREHPDFINTYIENTAPLFTTQRTKLFLILASAVNREYRSNMINIRRDVQRSRVNLRNIRNRDIVQLVIFESAVNDFMSALIPTGTALSTILSGNYLDLYEDDQDHVEDLQLENKQLIESAKTTLKNIQNIRSAYTSIVTNNLNQVIKFLTSLTIILTIPTLVGSLYGMNVTLPFGSHPLAFAGIAGITIVLMALVAYYFSRKEWI
jgi:magnesium transporter